MCWSCITSVPHWVTVTGLGFMLIIGSNIASPAVKLRVPFSTLINDRNNPFDEAPLLKKLYFRAYFLEKCCFHCGTCISPHFCWCNIPGFPVSASQKSRLFGSLVTTLPFLVSILTISFSPVSFLLSIHCLLPTLYVPFAKGLKWMIEYDKYTLRPLKWEKILLLTLYAWPIPPLSAIFSPSVLIPLSC